MKIKHFVVTRFMSQNFDKPNEVIFGDSFLQDAFKMMKNHLLRSLSIQNNKDFEFVILIHNEIDVNKVNFLYNLEKEYDFKITIIRENKLLEYVNIFKKEYDFIITSRIDYDDHIYKTVVGDTQKKVDENFDIILYGLKNGVTIINGETEARFMTKNYGNCGFFSVFETVIINTKKLENVFDVYSLGNHTKIYKTLKDTYKNYGIQSKDNIKYLCDDTDETRYIWTRHKNSQSFITKNTLHLTDKVIKNLNLSDFGYNPKLVEE